MFRPLDATCHTGWRISELTAAVYGNPLTDTTPQLLSGLCHIHAHKHEKCLHEIKLFLIFHMLYASIMCKLCVRMYSCMYNHVCTYMYVFEFMYVCMYV